MCVVLAVAALTLRASVLRVKVSDALVHREVLVTPQSRHLLGLLRVLQHGAHTGVVGQHFCVGHAAETGVCVALLDVPLVELFDVRDGVQAASGLDQVGVLGEQDVADDASAVVLGLEVGVGEANEDLFHLVLAEEVGQVSHAVRSVVVVKRIIVRVRLCA